MTRPEIIRADSIDLQNQDAPSAQDHTRQPTHPKPLGSGPPAPHQAEALREVAADVAEQHQRSPRVSKEWSVGEVQKLGQLGDEELAAGVTVALTGSNLPQQDALAVAQNGGNTGSTAEDAEMADAEGDDGMDDDMMDKISSSPSIDDGGYSFSQMWPRRSDSLSRTKTPLKPRSLSQACGESSSPFLDTPEHYPLRPLPEAIDKAAIQVFQAGNYRHHHHHLGEYWDFTYEDESNYDEEAPDELSPLPTDVIEPYVEHYDLDYDLDYQFEHNLLNHLGLGNELDHGSDFDPITIPYEDCDGEEEEEDDDDCDFFFADDSRFIDSGWGGECLQESEDIDFEFVYALHTFVATVEGQANATKGDTMVLLDDSNSYWWLVRVVKDSSIGYLPAEHIETPTERLARLNKHRNIDLTSTMLGDQAEKTKNPLKKAIRRRNAKTVAFAAPTYVEASDVDYSTEEEGDDSYLDQNGHQEQNGGQQDQATQEDEPATVEPLRTRSEIREVKSEVDEPSLAKTSSDTSRTSDEIEGKLEVSKSKNGTVRNTDSFFKDDSVETRKITLTPNLLRDDSSTSTRTSNESKELRQRASLDKLEKDSVAEKAKEKKERKEKKSGMLSGLFKRKDKKSRSQDDDGDELGTGKVSTDDPRASPAPSKESEELVLETAPVQSQEIQRQPSKLQKQPRRDQSPVRKTAQTTEPKPAETKQVQAPERPPPAESAEQPSMRLVQSTLEEQPRDILSESVAPETDLTSKEPKSGNPITKILRSGSNPEHKPIKAKKAKSRVELDDFDTSPEDSSVEGATQSPITQPQRPIPGAFPDSYTSYNPTPPDITPKAAEERLSESPVQVSPISSPSHPYLPPLMVDSSSQEEAPSPVSSPSPELVDAEGGREKKGSSTTSTSTATWSDANLRTFFDDDADIKDLLVVVMDKSGLVPAGPDHPITGSLFKEENAKLADITNRLDGMLGDWLARKMRAQGSR